VTDRAGHPLQVDVQPGDEEKRAVRHLGSLSHAEPSSHSAVQHVARSAAVTSPVLLAVAHGTVDPDGVRTLGSLVDRARAFAPGVPVELAYVDHAAPSVTRRLDQLAAQGADVAAVPLLLTAAAHSKGDIPASISAVRAGRPGARIRYGRPLGPHPLLQSALDARLREVGADPSYAVVLAAAGSADPDANADVAKVGRLLWEWRGGAPIEVGYASTTGPSVGTAIERLRRLGHDRVAVAPYFLAPGRLPRSVAAAAEAGGAVLARVLGDHGDVARLLLERYAEALAGDLRMNCDTCRYRAPQRPHSHPDDEST
jgi:sirohydrochlorin cobaltochelatase